MAIVYLLNTYSLNVTDELINLVEEKRQQKIKKSSNEMHKKELLGAGLLLRDTLLNKGVENININYNEFNKPFLADNEYYFSISHSNYIVALTISKQPIGLDIELIEPIKKGLEKNVLSADELKIYNSLNESKRLEYFYQVFTAKEALVKYKGTSITIKPSTVAIDLDVYTKRVNFFKRNYMAALCGSEGFSIIERVINKETGEIH